MGFVKATFASKPGAWAKVFSQYSNTDITSSTTHSLTDLLETILVLYIARFIGAHVIMHRTTADNTF